MAPSDDVLARAREVAALATNAAPAERWTGAETWCGLDGGWTGIGPVHEAREIDVAPGEDDGVPEWEDDGPDGPVHERAKADAALIAHAGTWYGAIAAELVRLAEEHRALVYFNDAIDQARDHFAAAHAQAVDDVQATAEELERMRADRDEMRVCASISGRGLAREIIEHEETRKDLERTKVERDEARAEAMKWAAHAQALNDDLARLRAEVERVTAERDEAREETLRVTAVAHVNLKRTVGRALDGIDAVDMTAECLGAIRNRDVSLEEAEAWLRGGAK